MNQLADALVADVSVRAAVKYFILGSRVSDSSRNKRAHVFDVCQTNELLTMNRKRDVQLSVCAPNVEVKVFLIALVACNTKVARQQIRAKNRTVRLC